MSYIKKRIEKNRAEDAEYRAAYDEETALLAQEQERRQEVMKRIASLRRSKHMTQRALAEAMSISQARVSQLERGVETLSIDSFLTMLDVLGARIEIVDEDAAGLAKQSSISKNDPGDRAQVA